MSTTIDERVVGMKFDNSDFEKNVKTSMDSLTKLKKSLDSTESAKGLENIGKAANGLKLDGLISTVEGIGSRFTTLGVIGVTALQNITNAAVNAGTALVKSLSTDQIKAGFQEYELKMGSIQTIMAGTGESLGRVNQKLDELNTYADKTIYSFSDMTNNIGKFTNAGVKLDDAVAAIQGVANVAAVSGSNAEQASHAMYNFAQALSAGYVKLIDWKSIENANMATVEFKQQLIDTAVEMGNLTKVGDNYVSTTTDMKGKVSDAFNATQMFNDSLSHQWMTTEVLTKTLGRYSDETTDIGKKAFAAAQDVKTFTQLMDTLKEAVGSGWAMTFQLIFGDFEQAKKLWTEVNDIVGDAIQRSSDARNSLLEGALSNDYFNNIKKAVDDLGVDTDEVFEGIRYNLTEMAQDQKTEAWSKNVKEITKDYKSVFDAIKDGSLPANKAIEALEQSIVNMKKNMESGIFPPDISDEEFLKNIEEAERVLKLLKANGSDLNKVFNDVDTKSGYELLTESLTNSLKALTQVMGLVKQAWQSVFPPVTSERLYEIIKSFNEFTQKLILGQKSFRDFSTILRGVFSALDILKKMFLAVAREVKPFIQAFTQSSGGLMDILLEISRMFIAINKDISNFSSLSEIFEAIGRHASEALPKIFKMGVELVKSLFSGIMSAFRPMLENILGMLVSLLPAPVRDFINNFVNTISNAIPKIIEKFTSLKSAIAGIFSGKSFSEMEGFGKILTTIKNNFKETSDNAKTFASNVKQAIDSITVSDTFMMFLGILNAVWEITQGLAKFLGTVLLDVLNAIATAVGKIRFDTLLNLLNAGILADLVVMVRNLLDPFDDVSDLIGNLKDDFAALEGMLKAFTLNINADSLLKIAGAVAILAGSLLLLSSLDSQSLVKSLTVITVMLTELTGSLIILTKVMSTDLGNGIKSGLKGFASSITGMFDAAKLKMSASAMLSLAEALLVMALAVKVLGSMNLGDLAKGLGAVSIMLAEIGVFLTATSKFGKMDPKSATAMILIAASLNVIASAVKKFGELDTASLIKGLSAVSVLLVEIGAFMAASKYFGKVGISSALAMVIIAESLKIFAKDIALFAQYNWGELGKAGVAIAGLLTIIGAFSELAGGAKLIATSVGLTIVGAALMIFAESMVKLSTISFENILKNFLALSLALGMLAAGAAIAESLIVGFLVLSATLIGISTGLLIFSAAMNVLVPALKSFGEMSWDEIAKAGVVLGGLVVVLGLFSELAGGAKFLATSVGLLLVAESLSIFAKAMTTLAALSFGEILKNFVSLALALGLLTAAAAIAESLAPGFIVLSVSLLAIGAGAALVGAGLAALGAGFATLATLGTAGAVAVVAALEIIIQGVARLIPDILRAIVEGFAAFAQAIVECGPVLFGAFAVIIGGILDVLITLIPKIVELIGTIISNVLTFIAGRIPEIINVFKVLLTEVINAFVEFIPKFVDAAVKIVVALIESFNENIPKFVDAGVGLINAFLQGIASMMTGIVEAAFNMVITFIDGLAKVISEKAPEIVSVTQKLMDVIFGAMEKIFTGSSKIKEFGSNVVSTLLGGFKSEASSSTKSITEMLSGMVSGVSTTASKLKELGSTLITNLVGGMNALNSKAVDSIKNLMNSLQTSIKSTDGTFGDLGRSIINVFNNGINSTSESARTSVKRMLDNMMSSIKEYRDSFYRSGQYVVEGLVRGIESESNSAINAARRLGNAIHNAFNNSIRINSPSKDFAESGMFIDLGVVAGVDKYSHLATKAMEELGSDVVSAFDGSYSGISSVIDGTDFNPRMRPILDMSEATRGANSMSNMFSDKRLELIDTIALNSPDTAYQNDIIKTMNSLRADVSYLGEQMSNFKMVLDSGALIGELTPGIDNALGQRAMLAGRGI